MLHLDARTCGDDPRNEHRAEAQRLDTHARPQSRTLCDAMLKRAMALGCKQRLKKRRTFSY
jgi:hypothetical protein